MARDLRFPFGEADAIEENYSQAWQDIFVLTMLGGLRGGRYLEIGCNDPDKHNNTYLLRQKYDWSGVSLEYSSTYIQPWMRTRPDDTLVIIDALIVDYSQAMALWFGDQNNRIDYLQLDIDPSEHTLAVLKRLPLDNYRFSIITFETDAYLGDLTAQKESREILMRHGYQLVAKDVSVLPGTDRPFPAPFEDWWVDPAAVSEDKIRALQAANMHSQLPQDILFVG